MSGRRKGEERRVNHDLFVGIRKWNQLDQARVRELYDNPILRESAKTFIQIIQASAPDMEKSALEGLAHSLIRDYTKTIPDKTEGNHD